MLWRAPQACSLCLWNIQSNRGEVSDVIKQVASAVKEQGGCCEQGQKGRVPKPFCRVVVRTASLEKGRLGETWTKAQAGHCKGGCWEG